MEKRTRIVRHRPSDADLALPQQPAEEIERRKLKLLILEDVALDAELIQRELRQAGLHFTAVRVEGREEFLESLGAFQPDIIISDYAMPQFNAMEALDLLSRARIDVPFVLVTGAQSEEVAVECMKQGADDYILKTTLRRLPSAVVNAMKMRETERDRERAFEALRRREEHFRSLIENALDIIAVLNPDGVVRYASPSVRVLGYAPEELVGRSLFDLVSADDSRAVRNVLQAVQEHPERIQVFEFVLRHRNDSWRILEAIGQCIRIPTEPPGIVLNARDISGRKQAEMEIEKLAQFPRLNPNPVFEISAEGELTYSNEAARQMAESLGRSGPEEILPEDLPDIVEECLRSGRRDLHREVTVGNRILSWAFFPIITSQVVHCYATDVTEQISLEAQLRQSQKMESIGQLAAGVAHDFNNILTVVKGYSGLLLERKDLSEDVHESIQHIAISTERAANLTRQLLMFSRKQVLQPQSVDLNNLITNVSSFLRRILGEQITLQFNFEPDLPRVHVDPGMIEQVVMNLAVNARDAMPRGGRLAIGTDLAMINDIHSRANPEARPGRYVCIRVSDTGSGIPRPHLARIFEPFFTTKEVGKGTGLGLATAYGIVKQHGGWIETLSEPGRGTTFRIFLPGTELAETVPEPPQAEQVRGGNETVLVVEDEPELRALVRDVLRHHGYCVLEAESGPGAMAVWEEHRERIDLLLTDMVMPGNLTGRELAEILVSRKPDLKVIYTSGYSMDIIGRDLPLKRGVNFLPKPYQPMTLVQTVRHCLDIR